MIYTAVFFENITKGNLAKPIQFPHITHEFRPNEVDYSLFGQKATFEVVGYGNDGINEGYLVKLVEASAELEKAFSSVEVPHITISVSENGKPVNTRFLNFKPCKPFKLVGVYGGFNGSGVQYEES